MTYIAISNKSQAVNIFQTVRMNDEGYTKKKN